MNLSDEIAFSALFKEAYLKCFKQKLESPMTETESKLLCTQVLDLTGLSIGWKSVKNYSFFVAGQTGGKPENPSAATLDTLARYVLGAAYTTELKRKAEESHYPYWFLYKKKFSSSPERHGPAGRWFKGFSVLAGGIVLVILSILFFKHVVHSSKSEFTDNFSHVSDGDLLKNGWFVKDADPVYWNKKEEMPGQLTLYTLKGDNWPDPQNHLLINNLLLRTIPYGCFTAEVHLSNFVPDQEWQQAGILLLEDTTLTGKSIRLSIAFNDFFAGSRQPKEVLIQAITSLGNGFGKPEEIAHRPIIFPDSAKNNPLMLANLQNSALRIEKQGNKFRFLFSGGVTPNSAFKEVISQNFDMEPRYIAIFAIKGFKDSTKIVPVHFTYFRMAGEDCAQ
jgi:hypothetical protein